jgi:hypothetical protein
MSSRGREAGARMVERMTRDEATRRGPRPPRARWHSCPECEASFTATENGTFPPHRGIRADSCAGAGARIPAAAPAPPKPDHVTAITLESWRGCGARTLARLDELSAHYAKVYAVDVAQQQERARLFVRAWEIDSAPASAPPLAEIPFSLTPPAARSREIQKGLF